MKPLLRIYWRAFSIVTCTAMNVVQVSNHRYGTAFFTGGLLSYVWWANTKAAAHSDVKGAQIVYATGAACGTVFGMWLGRLLG